MAVWDHAQLEELDVEGILAFAERPGERRMVDQNSASWNHLAHWLGVLDGLRRPVPRVSLRD